jgi:hypothetical protein
MFSQGPYVEELRNMITKRAKNMLPAFSARLSKPVVLLVKVHRYFVPMPCSILGETVAHVLACIQPRWELEIRNELILTVEEASASPNIDAN